MTFLPIVTRELIEASRRRGTYWIRLAVAAVGVLLGGWVMLVMRREPPWELGQVLLITLSSAVYLYCLFVGVFRTADCLSEEKREGTLGLLFLTDLKGYDIVLGKLVASSVSSFYGVVAIFPVMAIPLLVGGVTLAEFWRVVLVALNTLFFSLAVGLFCSAISRDERRSMAVAMIIVLVFAAGFPLASLICHEWRAVQILKPISEELLIPSPGYAAVMAFEIPFTGSKFNYFHASVIFTHALSWVLLIAASFIVPRTWQDRALTTAQLRRREKIEQLRLGNAEKRRSIRRRLLAINPVLWLLARSRTKSVAVWLFLGVVGLIWAAGLWISPRDWQDDGAYITTAIIVHLVLKFWIGTEACRRFSNDRQSGALELLLSTPIAVKDIVRGQVLALERQFAGPVFAVLLMDFVFLMSGGRSSEMTVMWIVGMAVFVADIVALSWVGMWRGLNSRRPNRAAVAAMVRVLLLPWIIYFILMTLGAFTDAFGFRMGRWEAEAFFILWGVISLAVSAYFAVPARRRLLAEFRQVATTRFDTGSSRGG